MARVKALPEDSAFSRALSPEEAPRRKYPVEGAEETIERVKRALPN